MRPAAGAGDDRPSPTAPAWAYERARVVAPDPGWAAAAARYRDEVHDLLGDHLFGDVAHVGSTAVPGLPAKPVIDLQARAVDPAGAVDDRRQALSDAHWHLVPRELDDRPWRWFLVRTDRGERHRLAHLHLMTLEEPRWHDQLAFRDALRDSDALAQEYARLKADAADRYGDDRERYTRAKDRFVRRVLGNGGHPP